MLQSVLRKSYWEIDHRVVVVIKEEEFRVEVEVNYIILGFFRVHFDLSLSSILTFSNFIIGHLMQTRFELIDAHRKFEGATL